MNKCCPIVIFKYFNSTYFTSIQFNFNFYKSVKEWEAGESDSTFLGLSPGWGARLVRKF